MGVHRVRLFPEEKHSLLPVSRNKNIWEGLRYNKLRAEAHMMMKAQFVLGGSRYRYDCRYGYSL